MEAKPCIFCQIAKKMVLSKIVYEDDNSVAFLDINPRSKGMTLVIPKEHYTEFDENFEVSKKTFQSAMIVAEMIKRSLFPKKINFSIIESEAVNHFHIRVYPVYEKEFPLIENSPIETNENELDEVAIKIRAVRIETPKEVKEEKEEKVEKKEERERSEEEVYWIRREMEKT